MLTSKLIEYSELYTQKENSELQKLNRETQLKVLRSRMISGHLQGRLLQFISQMIKPMQILEIGTFTGYSAICLAAGLQKGGKIHTIEKNQELEDIIVKYSKKTKISGKLKLYIGDAIDIIPKINETFDIVFIDADKENYLNYYNMVFSRVRKGGIIMADNALWDGKVLEKPRADDKETIGIIEFNKFILNDKRVENLLLPFRDGLQIIRKI